MLHTFKDQSVRETCPSRYGIETHWTRFLRREVRGIPVEVAGVGNDLGGLGKLLACIRHAVGVWKGELGSKRSK